ncbi:hypothetical protein [Bacillus horti]|uniref:Uncharacterized protein n=1 Tax=Caldalkalibacillus horti TaxID=77523 RepID=A0ABT9VT19_9BACI|nr:hypothetical protein [Bacillus horti]MDQ0164136.1 hypothetical protein [Bacillus horti]
MLNLRGKAIISLLIFVLLFLGTWILNDWWVPNDKARRDSLENRIRPFQLEERHPRYDDEPFQPREYIRIYPR